MSEERWSQSVVNGHLEEFYESSEQDQIIFDSYILINIP